MEEKPSRSRYEIHGNYNRPFIVDIIGDNVEIRCQTYSDTTGMFIPDIDPKATFKCQKIFVGESKFYPMTEFSGGYGTRFDGNTILLHIGELNYIWVGERISKFKARAEIVEFESPVGNNDVPYPWAKDTNENIYIILDDMILLGEQGKSIKRDIRMAEFGCPIDYFYNILNIWNSNDVKPILWGFGKTTVMAKSETFNGATGFYLGKKPFIFRYSSNPEKEYDRLTIKKPLYVTLKGKRGKREMSREEYIQSMKKYEEEYGLAKMEMIGVICERDETEFKNL